MSRFRPLRGAFTALVTPFRPDGTIDDAAFRRLVRWQILAGIDGLVRAAYVDPSNLPYPERLTASRFRLLSQNQEDGILWSLFQQIGVKTRTFVELGSGATGGNAAMLASVTAPSDVSGGANLCRGFGSPTPPGGSFCASLFRAPAACWCARAIVESTLTSQVINPPPAPSPLRRPRGLRWV